MFARILSYSLGAPVSISTSPFGVATMNTVLSDAPTEKTLAMTRNGSEATAGNASARRISGQALRMRSLYREQKDEGRRMKDDIRLHSSASISQSLDL